MSLSILALVLSTLALALAAVAFVSGRQELAELQKRCQSLAVRVEELTDDLAGLCAAGVQRDRATIEQDQRVRECLERVESLQVEDTGNYPYHGAIEMIRKGGNAQEVANQFGISKSEAELLVRLHRNAG